MLTDTHTNTHTHTHTQTNTLSQCRMSSLLEALISLKGWSSK